MTLPPLPPMRMTIAGDDPDAGHWYTADQLREYATAAVLAERAKCGGDNCFGRRLDGNPNWVTEEARDAAVLAEREAIAQMLDECRLWRTALDVRARGD